MFSLFHLYTLHILCAFFWILCPCPGHSWIPNPILDLAIVQLRDLGSIQHSFSTAGWPQQFPSWSTWWRPRHHRPGWQPSGRPWPARPLTGQLVSTDLREIVLSNLKPFENNLWQPNIRWMRHWRQGWTPSGKGIILARPLTGQMGSAHLDQRVDSYH